MTIIIYFFNVQMFPFPSGILWLISLSVPKIDTREMCYDVSYVLGVVKWHNECGTIIVRVYCHVSILEFSVTSVAYCSCWRLSQCCSQLCMFRYGNTSGLSGYWHALNVVNKNWGLALHYLI